MISLRSLLIIILILIIWRLGRAWYKRFIKNQQIKNQSPPLTKIKPGTMLRCDHCGVYLPENEALHEGNKVYCCEAHRQQSPKQ